MSATAWTTMISLLSPHIVPWFLLPQLWEVGGNNFRQVCQMAGTLLARAAIRGIHLPMEMTASNNPSAYKAGMTCQVHLTEFRYSGPYLRDRIFPGHPVTGQDIGRPTAAPVHHQGFGALISIMSPQPLHDSISCLVYKVSVFGIKRGYQGDFCCVPCCFLISVHSLSLQFQSSRRVS